MDSVEILSWDEAATLIILSGYSTMAECGGHEIGHVHYVSGIGGRLGDNDISGLMLLSKDEAKDS